MVWIFILLRCFPMGSILPPTKTVKLIYGSACEIQITFDACWRYNIYIYLELQWPLFLKVNLSKQGLFHSNQGRLGARYIENLYNSCILSCNDFKTPIKFKDPFSFFWLATVPTLFHFKLFFASTLLQGGSSKKALKVNTWSSLLWKKNSPNH